LNARQRSRGDAKQKACGLKQEACAPKQKASAAGHLRGAGDLRRETEPGKKKNISNRRELLSARRVRRGEPVTSWCRSTNPNATCIEEEERTAVKRIPVTEATETVPVAPVGTSEDITDQTLAAAPHRVVVFLSGVKAYPPIERELEKRGLNPAEQDRVWALVRSVHPDTVEPEPNPNAEAIAGCERFLANGLPVARAKLALYYPAQAKHIFDGIRDQEGGFGAALEVSFVVERYRQLGSPERKAMKKQDELAKLSLAEVGMTEEQIDELDALVQAARKTEYVPPAPILAPFAGEVDDAHTRALKQLHAWITAWSEIARAVLSRRVDQIRLGIAKRRAKRPAKKGTPVAAPTTPAIAPPAALAPLALLTPRPAPAAAAEEEDEGPASRAA
jgi:hypothetical protein